MENEIIDAVDNSIKELIDKLQNWKTIETSDLLRNQIITDLKAFQRAIRDARFREQINNIIKTLFPIESDMKSAFEIIDRIDEQQKDSLIQTLILRVIKPESEIKKYEKLQDIIRSIHQHICTINNHEGDIYVTKGYQETVILKFFAEKELINIYNWLGLTQGFEDPNANRIKFDPYIEKVLFDLDYLRWVDGKIQFQSKFTESCLYRLWLSWLAVNRNLIKDEWFITGFCSVFADIILGAVTTTIPHNQVDSKVRSSYNYDENNMDIKHPFYSHKELIKDVLFHLSRYVAYQFNGDGWVNAIKEENSAQAPVLSTAFREQIKGQPAVKHNAIYIQIRDIMVQIKAGLSAAP